MAEKAQYQTKQRSDLLEYLEMMRGVHLTAAQIKAHFSEMGSTIGMATVYRHMDKLEQEGLVRKYTLGSGDSACYEYVGQGESQDCASHFHCKCEQCGTLIHMECEELQSIQSHLMEHHGFKWNAGKTVFYGICDQCQAKLA